MSEKLPLDGVKILDSWFLSVDDLSDEIEDLQEEIKSKRKEFESTVIKEIKVQIAAKKKKIDQVKLERRMQPPITGKGYLGEYVVTRYQIINLENGTIVAEEKKRIDGT